MRLTTTENMETEELDEDGDREKSVGCVSSGMMICCSLCSVVHDMLGNYRCLRLCVFVCISQFCVGKRSTMYMDMYVVALKLHVCS